jgi:hypothetical protein
MILSIRNSLDDLPVCYRTFNERLITKTKKRFPQTQIFEPQSGQTATQPTTKPQTVPDRRKFLIINP